MTTSCFPRACPQRTVSLLLYIEKWVETSKNSELITIHWEVSGNFKEQWAYYYTLRSEWKLQRTVSLLLYIENWVETSKNSERITIYWELSGNFKAIVLGLDHEWSRAKKMIEWCSEKLLFNQLSHEQTIYCQIPHTVWYISGERLKEKLITLGSEMV